LPGLVSKDRVDLGTSEEGGGEVVVAGACGADAATMAASSAKPAPGVTSPNASAPLRSVIRNFRACGNPLTPGVYPAPTWAHVHFDARLPLLFLSTDHMRQLSRGLSHSCVSCVPVLSLGPAFPPSLADIFRMQLLVFFLRKEEHFGDDDIEDPPTYDDCKPCSVAHRSPPAAIGKYANLVLIRCRGNKA